VEASTDLWKYIKVLSVLSLIFLFDLLDPLELASRSRRVLEQCQPLSLTSVDPAILISTPRLHNVPSTHTVCSITRPACLRPTRRQPCRLHPPWPWRVVPCSRRRRRPLPTTTTTQAIYRVVQCEASMFSTTNDSSLTKATSQSRSFTPSMTRTSPIAWLGCQTLSVFPSYLSTRTRRLASLSSRHASKPLPLLGMLPRQGAGLA
jgi:hypothetical protein